MLDWTHLQTIALLARHRSIAAAAKELRVHPTTLSRRLDAAEIAIDEQIFLRSGKQLQLTSTGQYLIDALMPLVAPLDRISSSISETESQRVRIATTENGARIIAQCVIPELMELDPSIEVEVLCSNVTRDLREGNVDFAMRVVAPTESYYVRRNVGMVRYGLYAADSYLRGRTDFQELDHEHIIWPGGELANSTEARFLSQHAANSHVAFKCSSLLAIAGAAELGLGLAVLPTNLGVFHPKLQLVRRLDGEIDQRPVLIVYHSARTINPRLRRVLEVVVNQVSTFLASC